MENIHITIQRTGQVGAAMLGKLTATGITLPPMFTLERKWVKNQKGISCIPSGTYKFVPHGWEKNSRFSKKKVWEIVGVQGREAILIHVGNTVHDVEGCIAVGTNVAGAFVGNSVKAISIMQEQIGCNGGTITILDAPDEPTRIA